jgi:hypothetical protein
MVLCGAQTEFGPGIAIRLVETLTWKVSQRGIIHELFVERRLGVDAAVRDAFFRQIETSGNFDCFKTQPIKRRMANCGRRSTRSSSMVAQVAVLMRQTSGSQYHAFTPTSEGLAQICEQ